MPVRLLAAGVGATLGLVIVAALLSGGAARKSTQFIAVLNAGQVPAASESKGIGVAYGYLTDDDRFCFSISYDPPDSEETQAHIHGPAGPSRDAPLEWDLSDRFGSPRFRCVGPLTRKQKKNLRAAGYYIVIHSSEYERGELRAQIVPMAP